MRKALSVFVVLAVASGMTTVARAEIRSNAGHAVGGELPEPRRTAPVAGTGTYIVELKDPPVAAYVGGVPGLPAPRPHPGKRFSPDSPAATSYVRHLDKRRSAVLRRVGNPRAMYSFKYSLNGFAAHLSPDQVTRLRRDGDVLAVTADTLTEVQTSHSPRFLGLDAPNGLWTQAGGRESAGEGVIVGVLDTGIWPESDSFGDRADTGKKPAYGPPPAHWRGTCQQGERWTSADCNRKIIGARYFVEGFGRGNVAKEDYLSARDSFGHGTHVAATAAGNANVLLGGAASRFGPVAGIAPRARIAAYKVCWPTLTTHGQACSQSDIAAAIDTAVADGVDVINFSTAGVRDGYLHPVQRAFLHAASAGVFVAAAGGNAGPNDGQIVHPSPWLTTVAASTMDRATPGSVTVEDRTFRGSSIATHSVTAPVAVADTLGAPGATIADAAQCIAGALSPPKTSGKIVICVRGGVTRVAKSQAVKEAGGIGMILVNPTPDTVEPDFHAVPTVHLDDGPGRDLIELVRSRPGVVGTIAEAPPAFGVPAPFIARFSSRGPSIAAGEDVLKPDLAAPGVDILAAYSPDVHGQPYAFLAGTSMASPHVAGLAALLRQRHPEWSPMAIKSALMTTATDVLGQFPGGGGFTPHARRTLAQGAGHVTPNSASDPGLVYDAGPRDWAAFLKGQGLCCQADPSLPALPASDLNQASISIGALPGTHTVHRRVTNVGAKTATYNAVVDGLPGLDVEVAPQVLKLAPGQSAPFEVRLRRTDAPLNVVQAGGLRWTDGSHNVRSPVVVRPVGVVVPDTVELSGTDGAASYEVTSGVDSQLRARVRGLVPADRHPGTVTADRSQSFNFGDPAATPGVGRHDLDIPQGTALVRIALLAEHIPDDSDLDLYLYRVADNGREFFVGGSAAPAGASEDIVRAGLPPGRYTAYVHGFDVKRTADYTLSTWTPSHDTGALRADDPAPARSGEQTVVHLHWSDLAPDEYYFGAVELTHDDAFVGGTVIRLDTTDPG